MFMCLLIPRSNKGGSCLLVFKNRINDYEVSKDITQSLKSEVCH